MLLFVVSLSLAGQHLKLATTTALHTLFVHCTLTFLPLDATQLNWSQRH
jgi:hypothetical protein